MCRVPWWGWLLIVWGAQATGAAVLLGAVAATARLSERVARRHQYRERTEQDWRAAG